MVYLLSILNHCTMCEIDYIYANITNQTCNTYENCTFKCYNSFTLLRAVPHMFAKHIFLVVGYVWDHHFSYWYSPIIQKHWTRHRFSPNRIETLNETPIFTKPYRNTERDTNIHNHIETRNETPIFAETI